MKEFQVKDVAEIINGFAFESELFNNQRIGLPVVRIRDVVRGFSKTYYSGRYEKIYEVKNGDLLIGMDGEFNIAQWKGGKALLNQRVCKIVPKPEFAYENYLKFRLQSILKEIEDKTPFATVKHLSSEELKKSVIPLPKPDEQKRIAAILDKGDHLRRQRRFAQTLSDSFLQSVFIKMFGDPVSNPMNWETSNIGKYTSLVSSGSTPLGGETVYKKRGIRFIRSQNVLMNDFDFSDAAFIDEETHKAMKRTHVQKNDVLLNITGASIGRVACYKEETIANVNQHVCIIRLKDKTILPTFLSRQLSMPFYQKTVIAAQSGATRQAFNFDQIKDFTIIKPPLPLQEKFAEIVQKFERVRSQQREATRQAEHLFQTLLHRAFRGEL